MAHFSTTPAVAGSGDMIRFGLLEYPTLSPTGMWVPLVFEPSQAFLFGSLDFIADRLDMLHLHEEAPIPALVGMAPSVGFETPGDFNDEAPTLCSEHMLYSNPTMSNTHIVIYSLFTIFRQLSGGTPLSTPRPPCDRFPYGLASPADMYARGL